MADDFEGILQKLTPTEQEKVTALINTTVMQSELIREMSRDLQDYGAAAALQKTATGSVSLTRLGELLHAPRVQGPTVQEINGAIEEMRSSIESAQSSQEALNTILGFAVKVAPLFLV